MSGLSPRAIEAIEKGVQAAEDLKPGDLFTGAFGAADAAGYPASNDMELRALRGCFISGYLKKLRERFPNGVSVDRDGKLVQPQP
jgi:hypothetical protein